MFSKHFTGLRKDSDLYAALCPELDIASQGDSIEHGKQNLTETVGLFLNVPAQGKSTNAIMVKLTLHNWKWRLGKLKILSGKEV